ncbi:E3 ubiquitin-protein transferase RMND5B [Lemmus lemmus]
MQFQAAAGRDAVRSFVKLMEKSLGVPGHSSDNYRGLSDCRLKFFFQNAAVALEFTWGIKEVSALLGRQQEEAHTSFASGCVALPVLMNIKAVIEQRQCTGVWSHKDELPIEIELGMKCWYHSVFACPILRQQTSDSNPPIKLICGHVISRDALNKLINGGKLKCPYCPMEQNPADGKRIIF